jgi:hypothetical protein
MALPALPYMNRELVSPAGNELHHPGLGVDVGPTEVGKLIALLLKKPGGPRGSNRDHPVRRFLAKPLTLALIKPRRVRVLCCSGGTVMDALFASACGFAIVPT